MMANRETHRRVLGDLADSEILSEPSGKIPPHDLPDPHHSGYRGSAAGCSRLGRLWFELIGPRGIRHNLASDEPIGFVHIGNHT